MAEPRRRRVVEILADRGQLSATQICDDFDVTPQAMSQHLRILREANVIQMTRSAQKRLYTFNPKSILEIEKWAADTTEMWNNRFNRMDKALKDDEPSSLGGRAN